MNLNKDKIMKRLIKIGFQEAGCWKTGTNKSGIKFHLNKLKSEKRILYAFIFNDEICYIGKSNNSLETRMNGYKNAGGSQHTNIRVQKELKLLLSQNKDVKIYVLVDKSNYKYSGVRIQLAAGLEDSLIEDIQPEWNFLGKGKTKTRIKEQEVVSADDNVLVESNQVMILDKSIISTYAIKTNEPQNGRINFPKKQIDYKKLPPYDTLVTVYLGKEGGTFFEAKLIDSGNGNARINKSLLRNWYDKEHLSEQENFTLEIINPTIFRIYK